jgi:hypothetical protein
MQNRASKSGDHLGDAVPQLAPGSRTPLGVPLPDAGAAYEVQEGTVAPRRKWPSYLATSGFVLLVIGSLGAVKAAQVRALIRFGDTALKAGPPPEVVNSDVAVRQEWPTLLSAIATVVSTRGVTLSNDAPGVVSRIAFESGVRVSVG